MFPQNEGAKHDPGRRWWTARCDPPVPVRLAEEDSGRTSPLVAAVEVVRMVVVLYVKGCRVNAVTVAGGWARNDAAVATVAQTASRTRPPPPPPPPAELVLLRRPPPPPPERFREEDSTTILDRHSRRCLRESVSVVSRSSFFIALAGTVPQRPQQGVYGVLSRLLFCHVPIFDFHCCNSV